MRESREMVGWQIVYTKQAAKDAKRIKTAGLKPQTEKILAVIQNNPYTKHPPYEKLIGDLSGAYSRRINIQHRLVYQVLEDIRTIKILRMWTHYE